jgi:hypothetical protein
MQVGDNQGDGLANRCAVPLLSSFGGVPTEPRSSALLSPLTPAGWPSPVIRGQYMSLPLEGAMRILLMGHRLFQ